MKVLNRLMTLASEIEEAITDEVFDSWDSKKQRQWIKDHPTSKYAQKDYKKKGGKLSKQNVKNNKPSKSSSKEEAEQLKAVKNNPEALGDIKNPSEKVQLEAVKKDPQALEFIENPSEKVQLEAVKQGGDFIEYIKNPTEKVQMEAIKNDVRALEYIKNPSEKVQLEAVKKKSWAIDYIEDPSPKVLQAASKAFKKIKKMGIDTNSSSYKNALKAASFDSDEIEDDLGDFGYGLKHLSQNTKNGMLQIEWVSRYNDDTDSLVSAIKKNLKENSKNKMPVAVMVRYSSLENEGEWETREFVLNTNKAAKTKEMSDKDWDKEQEKEAYKRFLKDRKRSNNPKTKSFEVWKATRKGHY